METINKLLYGVMLGAAVAVATTATAAATLQTHRVESPTPKTPETPEAARTSETSQTPEPRIVTFRFVPGRDMFYVPWGGNEAELSRLRTLVDEHRAAIVSGEMPIYVDGYSASMRLDERDIELAAVRANRVKSELISNGDLLENHFITTTHIEAYVAPDGLSYRDAVTVTLRIPAKPAPAAKPTPEPEKPAEPTGENRPEDTIVETPSEFVGVVEPQPQPQPQTQPEKLEKPSKPYCIAIRTNLLYDAFLLPTLGVEWRATRSLGIKLDGGVSYWGGNAKNNNGDRTQKIWFVNPEVRWYLLDNKRLYVGAAAAVGEYNIYKGMVGGLFSKEVGYQGRLWNAGATVGYQLKLTRAFSLDFNLGLGYTSSKYDSFRMTNGVRVAEAMGRSKNFWGPTQAGVNLVWTIGKR
ncbi:MAG: DUF3575 domain-containing protein [Alistipes sp.]|jgi:hypothetical protein|nr:DUF3575 domain-containing protein [Alistipes sp.]